MPLTQAIAIFNQRGGRHVGKKVLAYSGALAGALYLLAHYVLGIVRHEDLCPAGTHLHPSALWDPTGSWDRPWMHHAFQPLQLADVFAMLAMAVALFVVLPAWVAVNVANERRQGTLDQLRTTPLSALALVLGLSIGAPGRLLLLCVGPMVVHVGAFAAGYIPLSVFAASTLLLVVGGFASALLGLFAGLAPQRATGGPLLALLLAASVGFGGFATALAAQNPRGGAFALLHPAGAINAAYLSFDGGWRHSVISSWNIERFFGCAQIGVDEYWCDHSYPTHLHYEETLQLIPVLSVALALLLALVLLRACVRRVAEPAEPMLSKWLLGGLWLAGVSGWSLAMALSFDEINVPATLIVQLATLGGLALWATPSYESWAVRLRQAIKTPFWHSEAAPHGVMWLLTCVLFAVAFAMGTSLKGEALLLASAAALSLPVFIFYASTGITGGGARAAFLVACIIHLIVQCVTIAQIDSAQADYAQIVEPSRWSLVLLGIARALALAVPAGVLFCQYRLRKRTLAGNMAV